MGSNHLRERSGGPNGPSTRAATVAQSHARATDADRLIGRRFGTFTIGPRIGRGGMGDVYRAHDEILHRHVAVKMLPNVWLSDPERRARFEREARLLASVNHPHIGAIYGVVDVEGVGALVLELIEGPTLADRIAEGPIEVAETIRIGAQIASALEAAHLRGIVHRDLKPTNIKLTSAGHVKVLDFGLAKKEARAGSTDVSTVADLHVLTTEGAFVGTPSYMSPEHARGYAVDSRGDIWAFGCILYEMLSGCVAFAAPAGGTAFDALAAVLAREPDWRTLPRHTPAPVRRLLHHCLRKDPGARLAAISEARVCLEALVSHRTHRLQVSVGIAAGFVAATVAAAAWWFALPSPPPDPVLSALPRQLTFAPGWEAEPALSPDGRMIAYTSNQSGAANIWIVGVQGGNPVRITAGEGRDSQPAWFPDSSAIAYVVSRRGRDSVWKTAPLGGSSTLLIDDASDPAVSPDGSYIAFTRPGASTMHRIAIAPADDPARVRFLTTDGDGLWDHRSPVWSPDGRTICYAAQNALWLVSLDGGKPRPLLDDGEVDRDPVWSADGRYIYFESLRQGTEALWRVSAAGGQPTRITIGTGPERQPSTSADGARLAYSTLSAGFDIALVDLRSGAEVRLPSARDETFPALAPNLRSLLFVSNRWNGRYDLWMQQLADSRPDDVAVRLTDHPGFVTYPSFSPDGRWIVYGRTVNNRRRIWVIPAGGGPAAEMTAGNGPYYHPAWSPAGSRIAFVSEVPGAYRIEHISVVDGRPAGDPTVAVSMASEIWSPAWSPDGSQVAFVAGQEIWIAHASGGRPPTRITTGAGAHRVRWNRHSRRMFASGFWGTNQITVRTVDPSTGNHAPPRFDLFLGETASSVDFDIGPDESLGAVHREDLRGDIWVLDSNQQTTTGGRDGRRQD
jgi:Tol biopolymer transport system component/serine/threonine protein kinase